MLSAFLPLIILAYATTELEGSLLLTPCTAILAWVYGTVAGFWCLLPDQLDRWRQRSHIPSFTATTGAFAWIVVGWIVLLQVVAAPGRLVPFLSRTLPQTWPMAISAVLFVVLHWWGRTSLRGIFQDILDPEQTETDFFRARMTLPILFFPPMLIWMMMEDVVMPQVAIAGLSDLRAFLLAPLFFLGLYLVSPYLFNLAWRAEPLPDPILRDRILDLAKRAETPISGVRLWNTFREPVPNAAVAGLSDRYRYVYVTGYLLDLFSLPQVLSAIAHEIGHLRLGHVWTYLLFSLDLVFLSLLVKLSIFVFHPATFQWLEGFDSTIDLGVFLVVFLLFFTALTRYSEHQADRFSAALVGPDVFANTMQVLQDFVQPPPSWIPSWTLTHPPFAARIKAIREFDGTIATLVAQARRIRFILAVLAVLVLGLAWAPAQRVAALSKLGETIEQRSPSEAGACWRALPPDMQNHPHTLRLLGETAMARGRPTAGVAVAAGLTWGIPLPDAVVLEILEHPTSPEVAFHLEVVQFLLQSLDLNRAHGVSLFDKALNHVQIALRQI